MGAAPDKDEGDKSKAPAKSRIQAMRDERKDEAFQPEMPSIGCGGHLIDYLWTWGPTMVNSMGEGPLTHGELCACQENTGIELSEWEVSTLQRLSREYLGESHRATKRDCAPPFDQSEEVQRSYDLEQVRRLDTFLG